MALRHGRLFFLGRVCSRFTGFTHAYGASLLLKAYGHGLVIDDYYGRSLLDLDLSQYIAKLGESSNAIV